MGPLFDFLPIISFFVALKFSDIYIATGVAVAVTIAVVIYQRVKKGRIEPMTLVSAGLMVVFGGLTIALHDETFVKWKPTVLELLLAIAFVVSRFVGDKPIAQRMLAKAFEAERRVWLRVNDGLTLFFVLLAGLNLWVAYTFSTDTWATFKVFGLIGLNIVALVLATLYLNKHGKRIEPATD
ncbi:MAG: septation protein A [Myxococcota bacterium]